MTSTPAVTTLHNLAHVLPPFSVEDPVQHVASAVLGTEVCSDDPEVARLFRPGLYPVVENDLPAACPLELRNTQYGGCFIWQVGTEAFPMFLDDMAELRRLTGGRSDYLILVRFIKGDDA